MHTRSRLSRLPVVLMNLQTSLSCGLSGFAAGCDSWMGVPATAGPFMSAAAATNNAVRIMCCPFGSKSLTRSNKLACRRLGSQPPFVENPARQASDFPFKVRLLHGRKQAAGRTDAPPSVRAAELVSGRPARPVLQLVPCRVGVGLPLGPRLADPLRADARAGRIDGPADHLVFRLRGLWCLSLRWRLGESRAAQRCGQDHQQNSSRHLAPPKSSKHQRRPTTAASARLLSDPAGFGRWMLL